LTMRAIPERLRDVSRIGAIQIDITFTFNFTTCYHQNYQIALLKD